jgi:hypothetical protein
MAFWQQTYLDKCYFQLHIPGLSHVSLLESDSGLENVTKCGQCKTTVSTSIVYGCNKTSPALIARAIIELLKSSNMIESAGRISG